MNVFEAAIGWIAPPECAGCGLEGESLCRLCAGLEILPYGEHCGICSKASPSCLTCQPCRRLGAPKRIFIATDYSGLSKTLLQTYKFRHQRAAVSSLAITMASAFRRYNGQEAGPDYLVVPVPTATSRVRDRGFDHAKLLARRAAKELDFDFLPVLRRVGQNRQVGAERSIRLAQQAGNYVVRNPKLLAGRSILLVDDVVTTGATLIAARKALRQAGAKKVDALVFAKRI